MSEDEDKDYTYILGISDLGLEYLRDVTEYFSEERMHLDFALKVAGGKVDHREADKALMFVSFRARFNPHRNYEAYILRTPITEKQLTKHIDECFETMRSLIRKKGIPIR